MTKQNPNGSTSGSQTPPSATITQADVTRAMLQLLDAVRALQKESSALATEFSNWAEDIRKEKQATTAAK